ncbi:MAG: alpha/beta fold hydrolase, partial [Mariprofundaceae bacterium]|nr:alpha/beta fold hydrolase [Mariprofundaceae bacterium]
NRLECNSKRQHLQLIHSIRQFALEESQSQGDAFVFETSKKQISLWVTSSQVADQQWATIYMSSSQQQEYAMQTLQGIYHLSHAELKLVHVLTHECHNLNDAASSLGVSVHTARTQLKHVFKKTRTSSQVELVKKVLSSPEVVEDGVKYQDLKTIEQGSSSKVRLYDGRYLAYREYGDKQGYPVLYFHSTTGGELECAHGDALCQQYGIRLLAISRPGYGESDQSLKRTAISWTQDVQQFLEHLNIKQCAIIAYSSGGPYGLACCHQMPDRISHLSLVSSPGLRPNKATTEHFSRIPFYRVLMQMVLISPQLMLQMVRLSHRLYAMDVEKFWRTIDPYLCPKDKEQIQEHGQQLKAAFVQGSLQGSKKVAQELELFVMDWGFEAQDIRTPMTIWHGEEDPFTPCEIAEQMSQVLETSKLMLLKQEGFYLLFKHWETILKDLTSYVDVKSCRKVE